MGTFSKVDYPSYGKVDNHTDDWEAPIDSVNEQGPDCNEVEEKSPVEKEEA